MERRHAAPVLVLFGTMMLAAACSETGGGPTPQITVYGGPGGPSTSLDSVMIEPTMDSVMIEPSRVKCYPVTITNPDTTTTTFVICKKV